MKHFVYGSILLSILVGLGGCATKTIGPDTIGKNKYVIARQEGAFPSGAEPLLSEAIIPF